MNGMRPCIVGFFDLIGIRRILQHGKPDAVEAMKTLEANAYGVSSQDQSWFDGIYVWNDSVLLVSYLDIQNRSVSSTFNHLHNFKSSLSQGINLNTIDGIQIYAICIKGMAFVPELDGIRANVPMSGSTESKYVYVRASSMALVNCFEIERSLGPKHRQEWYVDERIYSALSDGVRNKLALVDELAMYPDMATRKVYMGKGPLIEQ